MTERALDDPAPWWRTAVVYEVYPRSFADGDGDGIGDIAGLRARLPHLVDLGVDAIWIAPWYPSPMADGGYDISDHCAIDPVFGTLDDADALIADAHAAGIRVIVDLVANHTSEEHPWFTAALAGEPGARARYHFADGRGPGGDEPPNDWISAFGGPAWTRVVEADGRPGPWYLHQFAPEQPDLNWDDPVVHEGFDAIITFWLDRGVDGLRLDAVPAMAKRPGLPDAGHGPDAIFDPAGWTDSPHWDVDEVHEILRRWRKIADSYDGDRMLVVEAVVHGPERLARYLRPDEAHTAFTFDYLRSPWDAGSLRTAIEDTLAALAPVGAAPTWVLSSHDETRHPTRFGRDDTGAAPMAADVSGRPVDLGLGARRARAAVLLTLALPGGAYLYQGEELGLPEVDDLPDDVLTDPAWERSGHTVRGRDGCRVPLPWEGAHPPFGFSPDGVAPWLPQPAGWSALTAAAQRETPGSMLRLYRAALHLRRSLDDLHTSSLTWCPATDGVLVFDRGAELRCVVNLSGAPVDVSADGTPLLSSESLVDGRLPGEATVWLRR
ncbi:alpha-glucosidase [Pseudonocardia sediminis]|uniref:Alpha-glucosidase n=1 Tax=Pseudonocardia sediminis TaxID=1397368 RepID=A0A4Q7UVW0_PSEST|nr:glycoside hydrolase family 13 protein [Pseudonocardia sediminis]RZT86127.1 alpha-glucosidase [Pseudonocardia sediminis]